MKDIYNTSLDHEEDSTHMRYYELSRELDLTADNEIFLDLIRSCISDETLTKENRYYAYRQLIRYKFLHQEANTPETNDLLDDLFDCVLDEYTACLGSLCHRIPKEERSKELVIVLTTQMLGLSHAPTKLMMDRCYALEKNLNKKVFIINTADVLSEYGKIPWYKSHVGGYIEELSSVNTLKYRDTAFSYFQCPRQMPDANIIGEILKLVSDEKPEYIIAVGENNLTACLCSKTVPVLTLTLTSTARIGVRTTFQAISGDLAEEDKLWLKKHNFPQEHFVEGAVTYALSEQKNRFSRKDLKLPEDGFICICVGYRLDNEVDDGFLQLLQKLAKNDVYTVFVGNFDRFDEVCRNYSELADHLIPLGIQNDTLAIYECCDVYINPKRIGGGTSAVEAMSKALPVLTLDYGDIKHVAGRDFCYDSYDDMYEEILQLAKDPIHLNTLKEKALKRAGELTDTAGSFPILLERMEQNTLYW